MSKTNPLTTKKMKRTNPRLKVSPRVRVRIRPNSAAIAVAGDAGDVVLQARKGAKAIVVVVE